MWPRWEEKQRHPVAHTPESIFGILTVRFRFKQRVRGVCS